MCGYQVGVFPVTKEGKVVLVKTRSGGYWIFPKGHREKGRSDRAVAREEAFEEAGVEGVLSHKYVEFRTPLGKVGRLRLYPMRVKKVCKNYPEADERQRIMVSFDKAEKLLEKDLCEALRLFRKQIGH